MVLNDQKNLLTQHLIQVVKPFVAHGGNSKSTDSESNDETKLGKAFYKHLMNGVSNMLP